jgi:sortase A
MEGSKTSKALGGLERVLLVLGVLLLSFYVVARIHGLVFSHSDLSRFWRDRKSSTEDQRAASFDQNIEPDFQLWSPKRIAAYKITLESGAPPPLAALRIGVIHLEVPVLEGTDDFILNRAVGHIDGTAEPREEGNVGIAGHRDGFFRGLKDIHQGDGIELITRDKRIKYVVDETMIVSPEDVSVLAPRSKSSLTLVTCYPFYFVGSAPQRFIVHATIASPADTTEAEEESLSAGKEEANRIADLSSYGKTGKQKVRAGRS